MNGNSFKHPESKTVEAKVFPLWYAIEEKRSAGVSLKPSDKYPVGTVFEAGTPIQLSLFGKPKLGLEATRPSGLIAARAVMGKEGCSFAVVSRGIINENAIMANISQSQKDYLSKRIKFIAAAEISAALGLLITENMGRVLLENRGRIMLNK